MNIPVRQKYRFEGKWPKSQPAPGTPNGGDAYLGKNKIKSKLRADQGAEHRRASAAGMRTLVILASGRRTWR